jgi:hypothetical protein
MILVEKLGAVASSGDLKPRCMAGDGSWKVLDERWVERESMRMLVRELAILTGGVVIGAAFSYVAMYAFYGRAGGIADWGFPFVWKLFASASPEYLDYAARYEDVVFWLAVSVIIVEFMSHEVWPRLKPS